jgi:hypothetical protein
MAVWGAGDQEWLAGTAGTFTMSPYVATGAHIRHVGGTSYEVTVTYDPVPPDAKPLRRPKRQPARKPTLAEALASMRPTMTGTATLPPSPNPAPAACCGPRSGSPHSPPRGGT